MHRETDEYPQTLDGLQEPCAGPWTFSLEGVQPILVPTTPINLNIPEKRDGGGTRNRIGNDGFVIRTHTTCKGL